MYLPIGLKGNVISSIFGGTLFFRELNIFVIGLVRIFSLRTYFASLISNHP